jgi:hypothetical protein
MNLPMMNDALLEKLTHIQKEILEKPQIEVNTEHIIHGGMYIRTIRLAPEIVLVGALVKVSTVLIVSGKTAVFTGENWIELDGYHVIPARAGRKQIFVTREETSITMIFPTGAKTVEQAEEEFTSEAEALMSRKNDNDAVLVTGA